jgi:hypothetical protein
MDEVAKKVTKMENLGVIVKVTEPTDWCSSMVIVPKPNNVRICVDLTHWNSTVTPKRYMLLTIEDVLHKLPYFNVLSTFEASSVYWH